MPIPDIPSGKWIDEAIGAYANFRAWLNAVKDAAEAAAAAAAASVQTTRQVATDETTLTGGGNLSANRTLSVKAGGVGTTQLADSAVTSAKILDGTIVAGDLADSAVTSAKILDGTIVDADINASAAIAQSKVSGLVTGLAGKADRVGLYLPGTSGNYASAPYVAAFDITGDIDVRWVGSLDDWTPATPAALIGRWVNAADQRGWHLSIAATNGRPTLTWSATGATTAAIVPATASPTVTDGAVLGIRATLDVDNGASGNTVTFYTSEDGVTWTQLGSPVVTAGVTSLFASTTAPIEVGSVISGASLLLTGRAIKAEVRNGIGGTVVASPNFADEPGPQRRDAQGNVWTVNGTGHQWKTDAGALVPNTGYYIDESVGRRAFVWDPVNNRFQMIYGDTGARNLAAETLSNGWTVDTAQFWISRNGSIVTVSGWLNGASATNRTAYTLPSGFRPAATFAGTCAMGTSSAVAKTLLVSSGGAVEVYGYGTGVHYLSASFRTNDAWPASLPGSAIGSIPSS